MKPTVYVETSVIGYLTSWPSGDLVVAGRQKITRDWWRDAAARYELIVSEVVLREASTGDAQAMKDRLAVLEPLQLVDISNEAAELAQTLMAHGAVPSTETEDALHIALAAVHGMEYLVTWNFKHIANAAMRRKINDVCVMAGYDPPIICSPDELAEE
jgi:predicted nucleic acid-binding protein